MVYKFFEKKAVHTGEGISENLEFANELHRPSLKNFKGIESTYLMVITFGVLILRTYN